MKAKDFVAVPCFLIALLFPPGQSHAIKETPLGWSYGAEDIYVEFHGFLTIEYFDYQSEGRMNGASTFHFPYLYVIPSAQISKKVFAQGEIKIEHGGALLHADRAWIQYSPFEKAELLSLHVGAMYVPFFREVDFSQSPLRLISERPHSAEMLGFNQFYDVGVKVMGLVSVFPHGEIFYNLGLYNGREISFEMDPELRNDKTIMDMDVNSEKMPAGRLEVWLLDRRLRAGSGVFYDRNWAPDTMPTMPGMTMTPATGKLESFGISGYGEINVADVLLRGEWAQRRMDRLEGGRRRDEGWYVQGAYGWKPGKAFPLYMVRPVVQVDSVSIDGKKSMHYAFGVQVWPLEYVQLRTEYHIYNEEPELRNNGFLVDIVAEF